MKKRIVSALLAGFLLVSATACGKQPAADAAQPVADPTQAYLDTVDVDYAYDLALKLEDIRSNETLGYRTAGSDAELATGDMLKAEMERIGGENVTNDSFTLDTQDSLFGLSRRCILLGFPAHTLPFRCGESTSLSTASSQALENQRLTFAMFLFIRQSFRYSGFQSSSSKLLIYTSQKERISFSSPAKKLS